MWELKERENLPLKPYEKNPAKNVMLPVFATKKHVAVEERTDELTAWVETSPINRIEDNGSEVGVIAAGSVYQYAREALGDSVSYLKLGMVNPLPEKLIRTFAGKVKKLYVIEELDPSLKTSAAKSVWRLSAKTFSRAAANTRRAWCANVFSAQNRKS